MNAADYLTMTVRATRDFGYFHTRTNLDNAQSAIVRDALKVPVRRILAASAVASNLIGKSVLPSNYAAQSMARNTNKHFADELPSEENGLPRNNDIKIILATYLHGRLLYLENRASQICSAPGS